LLNREKDERGHRAITTVSQGSGREAYNELSEMKKGGKFREGKNGGGVSRGYGGKKIQETTLSLKGH